MGAAITGAILWLIGKVAHIGIVEKLGYYIMIFGLITFGLGFVGINFSLPFIGSGL